MGTHADNTTFTFPVSTKVPLDQARTTLDEFKAAGNQQARTELDRAGFDVAAFQRELTEAVEQGAAVESHQERLKLRYVAEAAEDRDVALEGYRWAKRLHAKARHYLTSVADDPHDVAEVMRFNRLRRAAARGVVYEMRILLPEAAALSPALEPFGVDADFVEEGWDILHRLGVERSETSEVKAERKQVTRRVRSYEREIGQMLRRLVAADEVCALERSDLKRCFRLDMINAEMGRLSADQVDEIAAELDDALGNEEAPVATQPGADG